MNQKFTYTSEGNLSSDGSAGGWNYPAKYIVTFADGTKATFKAYEGSETALAKELASKFKVTVSPSDGKTNIALKICKAYSPEFKDPRGATENIHNKAVVGDVLVCHSVVMAGGKPYKVGRYYVKQ